MKSDRIVAFAAKSSNFLTIFVFVGIAALLASGYRATREWKKAVTARIADQNEEGADLIIKTITRDMRGAQARIIANRDWDAPLPEGTDVDMTEQVATTFARYPYPESYFTWRGQNHSFVFFSRATRLPQWMPPKTAVLNSPIVVAFDPPIADQVRQQVALCISALRRYAVFNITFAGVPYQIIARVTYTDPLREHLESVSGFTVNLDCVRKHYFAEILSDVRPRTSGGLTQDVALLDEHNRTVFGSNNDDPPVAERTFPLLFMDSSDTASDLPADMMQRQWKIRVSASRDPMLLSAARRADTTLLATAFAVVLCGLSLRLAHKAVLSGAKLSEMRSRLVSSVTHELKTPLANINVLAATLARESQVSSERYRAYPHLVIQEANNLSRLVDNLLAYARITDVTESYEFESMTAAELVEEAMRVFQPQFWESRINVHVKASQDLPCVRADHRSMVLALKNLIANAVRHVRNDGHICISTNRVDSTVFIEVLDDGCGISPEKLAAIRASIASRAFSPADGGGLGFTIASKVIADHSGKLTVESTFGAGTRCIIALPAD